ncbi:MAG: hypothetical protein KA369_03805 [Spirochaetes bacterium]|nr:hypothetical protein [Spirochaetota bacterium]
MNRTKKYALAAAVLLLMAVLPGRLALSKPAERILVLGFDSTLINNIQDRLLRETIMRELRNAGYPIVPVMEVESIFHEGPERQIRKLSREEIMGLCRDMKAGYACCGSIVPEGGKASDAIKAGNRYACVVTLYNREKNKFEEIRLSIGGEDNLYRFYEALSKMIAAEIGKRL